MLLATWGSNGSFKFACRNKGRLFSAYFGDLENTSLTPASGVYVREATKHRSGCFVQFVWVLSFWFASETCLSI